MRRAARGRTHYFGAGVAGFAAGDGGVVGVAAVLDGCDGGALVVGFGLVAAFVRARRRVVDTVMLVFTVGFERTHCALQLARAPSAPVHADWQLASAA